MTPGVFLFLAGTMFLGLAWLFFYTMGRRIGEDRRSGILELLLTTGLSPKEIVEGQRLGARLLFRPVFFWVFAVLFLLSLWSLLQRDVEGMAWVSFLLAWSILFSLTYSIVSDRQSSLDVQVMWNSLNSARPAYAVWKLAMPYWILPGGLFINFDDILIRFPTGRPVEVFLFGFMIVLMALLSGIELLNKRLYGKGPLVEEKLKTRLMDEFRSIAAEPVPEKSDPRFKGRDGVERLSENVRSR